MASMGDTVARSRPTKPAIHQSDLMKLFLCAKQWELSRVDGHKETVGLAAHVGTGVHAGIEANLGRKKHTGELEPAQHVFDVSLAAFRAAVARDGVLLSEEEAADRPAAMAAAEAKVLRLADLHYRELAPKIVPLHLERRWRVALPGGSHDLEGTIDIQDSDGIIDVKTKSKSPPATLAEDSIQLTMYALAVKVLDGAAPKRVRLDCLVDLKTPKVVTLESTRGAADFAELGLRLGAAMKQIAAGVFPPCDPSSWICSAEHCAFHAAICAHGARRRVQVST